MIRKRLFDLFFSSLGVFLLAPLFLVVSIWIKFDSPGPVFFRQKRVGRFGRPFSIFKFRTMCQDADKKGRLITVGEDPRITRLGRFLRQYKIDELPQLFNVVIGDMSLVGPRPEVPHYVECYPVDVRTVVLSVPPGITDYASLAFKDESSILESKVDPVRSYIEEILPLKLQYCLRYVAERTLWNDFKIILATLRAILR